ncbi:MAG: 3-dehydroquinate synthase [Sorangiineae bacterium]|nr:3-dehydroquinate synthase [Polyangiaceae bacterium]MEB2323322.1 3-dehydroquinate synthase [Sorangiineae bacterium]
MARPLIVDGFMATGKSTVGRAAAARLGRPFVDLDAQIEAGAGARVSEIFRAAGEAEFRRREAEELERALARSDAPVIAVGGGALLERARRLDALDRATVVVLEATPEESVRRAEAQGGRPLLAVERPLERARALLAERAPAYREAHARLTTDGRAVDELASVVADLARREPIAVAVGARSYAVEVTRGGGLERAAALTRGASAALLVTDAQVAALYGAAGLEALRAHHPSARSVALEPGEVNKRIAAVEGIWRAAFDVGLDRGSVVLALGGGVTTDVAGFAAATFMRGVGWVAAPTTLLAMVDASVGGKTGVDLGDAKNGVGAFWQPRGVVCDVALAGSEPARGFTSALAEVVKTAIIGDPALFELLETHAREVRARDETLIEELVRRSVRVKARIVSRDEREDGERVLLNLGHTVGHALEAHGDYSRYTHGEAVALGLVAALVLGERLGETPRELRERTTRLLGALGLPCAAEPGELRQAAALLARDKKRAGARLRFVVARALGETRAVELELGRLAEMVSGEPG